MALALFLEREEGGLLALGEEQPYACPKKQSGHAKK